MLKYQRRVMSSNFAIAANISRCCFFIDVDGNYLLCCASHNVKIGYCIDDEVSFLYVVVADGRQERHEALLYHPKEKSIFLFLSVRHQIANVNGSYAQLFDAFIEAEFDFHIVRHARACVHDFRCDGEYIMQFEFTC